MVTAGIAIVHLRPVLVTSVVVAVVALVAGGAGAAAAGAEPPNTALALAILAAIVVGGPIVVILVLSRGLRWAVLTDQRVLLLRTAVRSGRPTSLDRADLRTDVTVLPEARRRSAWPKVAYRTRDGAEHRLRFQPIWPAEAAAFRAGLTTAQPLPPPPPTTDAQGPISMPK